MALLDYARRRIRELGLADSYIRAWPDDNGHIRILDGHGDTFVNTEAAANEALEGLARNIEIWAIPFLRKRGYEVSDPHEPGNP
jgi:hypothetical protein